MSTFVVGWKEYDSAEEAAKAIHKHDKGEKMFYSLWHWKALEVDKSLEESHRWLCDQHFADAHPVWTMTSILETVAKVSDEIHDSILIGDEPDEIVGVLEDDWYEGCIGDAEALGSPDAEPMTIEVTFKVTI